MPSPEQLDKISEILSNIRIAESRLDKLRATISDTNQLIYLNYTYRALSNLASSLTQLETIANDAIFNNAIIHIKEQIRTVEVDIDQIKKISENAEAIASVVNILIFIVGLVAAL